MRRLQFITIYNRKKKPADHIARHLLFGRFECLFVKETEKRRNIECECVHCNNIRECLCAAI